MDLIKEKDIPDADNYKCRVRMEEKMCPKNSTWKNFICLCKFVQEITLQ